MTRAMRTTTAMEEMRGPSTERQLEAALNRLLQHKPYGMDACHGQFQSLRLHAAKAMHSAACSQSCSSCQRHFVLCSVHGVPDFAQQPTTASLHVHMCLDQQGLVQSSHVHGREDEPSIDIVLG
jgi:hypothetical protein